MAVGALAVAGPVGAVAGDDLADLSLEELGLVEITSVSKTPEPLFAAPASVYVITRDDIVRSGVTSIPEALRLAPGVEVARRGANAWSIAIRGFNGDLSNKLLVLLDGRSVYSPLYAGVFWDVQDTLLQDVDRIEVVSGPGGTLWGANAVNGVINVITRSADDTRSPYLEFGGGGEERGFAAFRFGGTAGNGAAYRAYVKYQDRDSSRLPTDEQAIDDWRIGRAGFRVDTGRLRVQGDVYDGEKATQVLGEYELGTLPDGTVIGDTELSGGNVMAEWERPLGDRTGLKLRVYYDRTDRDIPNTYGESRDTLDVDFQQHATIGARHDLLWGAGLRYTRDDIENSTFSTFEPSQRGDRTYSLFLQDRIGLRSDRLFLTLGSKFEHNDYSGYEVQPNARLAWQVDDRQTAWFAVSRAVRIPSRLDSDLRLTVPVDIPGVPFPVYVTIDGSPDFDTEELLAYEAGYRVRVGDFLNLDVAAFVNDYDGLQTTEARDPVFAIPSYILLPNALDNNMFGRVGGGSLATDWQLAENWHLKFHYSYVDLHLRLRPESVDQSSTAVAGRSPRHQASLFSYLDLSNAVNLYLGLRYVDELPAFGVDAYTALDLSLRWRFADHWYAALTARNLADEGHPEFGPGLNEIERSVYARVSWAP